MRFGSIIPYMLSETELPQSLDNPGRKDKADYEGSYTCKGSPESNIAKNVERGKNIV
jgi:hypothetical protein